jgi:DNA-binding PadR family transcriptional regulator
MDAELAGLGRFAGPATLILSSLAQGPKHGYGITLDIEEFAGVRLQPGTLYGALSRLEHDGLIEALAGDGRRRPYGITPHGAQALKTQLTAQRRVSEVGLRRLSLGLMPS